MSRFTNTVNGETIFTGNTTTFKGINLYTGRGAHPESDFVNGLEFHEGEYQSFLRILDLVENKENPTMIELGSWWAFWSLVFRQKFPNGRNILVEYSKRNLQIGLDNFQLNDYDVEGVHGGFFIEYSNEFGSRWPKANERCGKPSINNVYYKDDGSKYTRTPIFWDGSMEGDVTGDEIDFVELYKDKKINTIDLLHMDIQGSEILLMDQLIKEQILDRVNVIVIATHSPEIHGHCIRFLKDNGFNLFQNSHYGTVGGDGMLVGNRK